MKNDQKIKQKLVVATKMAHLYRNMRQVRVMSQGLVGWRREIGEDFMEVINLEDY